MPGCPACHSLGARIVALQASLSNPPKEDTARALAGASHIEPALSLRMYQPLSPQCVLLQPHQHARE
eukprot:365139-Chlamydomonas_euryale.AAC.2